MLIGKNTGPLFGMPPTNKELAMPMIHVYDFEDDKINRWRCYANIQILTKQLMGEQPILGLLSLNDDVSCYVYDSIVGSFDMQFLHLVS